MCYYLNVQFQGQRVNERLFAIVGCYLSFYIPCAQFSPHLKRSLLRSCRGQGLIHTVTQIDTLFKTFCMDYHYCVLIYDTIYFDREVAPKSWYLSTRLYHVTSQKARVCEVTAQITLNLLFI